MRRKSASQVGSYAVGCGSRPSRDSPPNTSRGLLAARLVQANVWEVRLTSGSYAVGCSSCPSRDSSPNTSRRLLSARLVQAMSGLFGENPTACSVSAFMYRDATVYGHATTAMHDNEYPPPPRARARYRDAALLYGS